MSSFSDYLENAALSHVFRGISMPSPAQVYLALYTAVPTDAGGREIQADPDAAQRCGEGQGAGRHRVPGSRRTMNNTRQEHTGVCTREELR